MSIDVQSICWFRQDLRLADNPAFTEAARAGSVLPVYIFDEKSAGDVSYGAASRWWLHHSLQSLAESLDGQLRFYTGNPREIFSSLLTNHSISHIFWNRCYEPWRITRDAELTSFLQEKVQVESFNGSLLWEPRQVLKKDGTPYKVFTPFYKYGCLSAEPPRDPLPVPGKVVYAKGDFRGVSLEELELLPSVPWGEKFEPHWEVGETGAEKRLSSFLSDGIGEYKKGRDFPSSEKTSRLSPSLRWGELSPHQVWYEICQQIESSDDTEHYLRELAWREFSYSLLYHFPDLPTKNFREKFDNFPWEDTPELVECWQQGKTGYPLVDAGMRELWQTGYMHNRVRMIVGSFLVKNLLQHWHYGQAWFWDCLLDADLASNSASWQWVAGCGVDAAPYFRIFNPITQGKKFDPEGVYIRQHIPELKMLPDKFLCSPWEAPSDVLKEAGIELGVTYPHPIVEVKSSRERALEAFQML